VRQQEEFATNQSRSSSGKVHRHSGQPQKINIDEFKTEALDELFGVSSDQN
jgi:hypothetical protein